MYDDHNINFTFYYYYFIMVYDSRVVPVVMLRWPLFSNTSIVNIFSCDHNKLTILTLLAFITVLNREASWVG